jgi:hypothetical protein
MSTHLDPFLHVIDCIPSVVAFALGVAVVAFALTLYFLSSG